MCTRYDVPIPTLTECEGCGKKANLIIHHWHEDTERTTTFYKYICESCNKFLETKTTDGLNHVLPNWELQSSLVKARMLLTDSLEIEHQVYSFATSSKVKLNCNYHINQLIPIIHCYPFPSSVTLILERWNRMTNRGNLYMLVLKDYYFNSWCRSNLPNLIINIAKYNKCLRSYNKVLRTLGRNPIHLKTPVRLYILNNGVLNESR
jgi:hypothetical protein